MRNAMLSKHKGRAGDGQIVSCRAWGVHALGVMEVASTRCVGVGGRGGISPAQYIWRASGGGGIGVVGCIAARHGVQFLAVVGVVAGSEGLMGVGRGGWPAPTGGCVCVCVRVRGRLSNTGIRMLVTFIGA